MCYILGFIFGVVQLIGIGGVLWGIGWLAQTYLPEKFLKSLDLDYKSTCGCPRLAAGFILTFLITLIIILVMGIGFLGYSLLPFCHGC